MEPCNEEQDSDAKSNALDLLPDEAEEREKAPTNTSKMLRTLRLTLRAKSTGTGSSDLFGGPIHRCSMVPDGAGSGCTCHVRYRSGRGRRFRTPRVLRLHRHIEGAHHADIHAR